MPTFSAGDARITFTDSGEGPPVLCLAPGGLAHSRAELWARAPWNPLERLAGRYRLIAPDQRNTGTSWAPVRGDDGWHSYAADQLALADHLGLDRFAVVGMCIGGAFIAKLLEEAPERVTAAVAMQPIGLDGNRATFHRLFDDWRAGASGDHPEATDADWQQLRANLFDADRLLFSVDDAVLAGIDRPMLVLRGDDDYHPAAVSERLAEVVGSATLVERWKDAGDVEDADRVIQAFLAAHAA
ncbi:MAG TPA: alpha/beta hydrolase [Acidimicrobiales bacterium]|nr:alpha/beta hydrolase [Acidimicrobiales bacterium]